MIRKILLVLLVALIIIQFIHPKRNKAEGAQPNYIGNAYGVPADVKNLLAISCNDCHSNNTRYPWYSKIQPVDWWLTDHVNDGKKELNLDEFANRPLRYQYKKMEEVVEMLEDNKMPLKSYKWIHKDAILDSNEKTTIMNWAKGIIDTMKSKYPMDSLVRKK